MTVHHAGALRAGLVTVVAMLALTWYRDWRVSHAEKVEGRVHRVYAFNERCKGKRGGDCTGFRAVVLYEVRGTTYELFEPAGSARGYDRPLSEARLRAGHTVSVVYDPGDPADHFNGGWTVMPTWIIGILGVGVVLVVVGLKPPRTRRAAGP
jgi:hypothetical protein